MGSYIELAGEERMRPRSGDIIIFPPERRRAKDGVRASGRTLREKYGISLVDATLSYQTEQAVSERRLVKELFHGRPDLPFCVVVNRVLTGGVLRATARVNSFDAADAYPAGAFAVTGFHFPASGDAERLSTILANVMGTANLGQSSMDGKDGKIPRSSLAGQGVEAPSPLRDEDLDRALAAVARLDAESGSWTDSDVHDAAGTSRLGDLLHLAASRWLDMTTRFPSLRQFAISLKMLENESIRVYRPSGFGLADAAVDAFTAGTAFKIADVCAKIAEHMAALASAKDALSAYGRKIEAARRPAATIQQAVAELAAGVSATMQALAPAQPARTAEPTTPAQAAAYAVRVVAIERRTT